jgi:predicted NAD/FAD-binding protein
VPYFKVIDKATGEVLVDQPIKSIEQTPTGVKITTADGKDHTLDFSAENGRPILSISVYRDNHLANKHLYFPKLHLHKL